jgi:hypothetical protein
MSPVEFVFIDGIAIGVLVLEEGRRRFCGSTRHLRDFEDLTFGDLDEAQKFFTAQLGMAGVQEHVKTL